MPSRAVLTPILTGSICGEQAILALMLAHEVEAGVFETLKVLEQYEIAPFEDGYEGSPFHDFIGRISGEWEWPES